MTAPAPGLSPGQRRVVAQIARGLTRDDVANLLHISPHTVKAHLRVASRNLGARNAPHLVALAIAHRHIPAGVALTKGEK